jgi:hypothetical protein
LKKQLRFGARQLDNHEYDVPAQDAACETFALENIGQHQSIGQSEIDVRG